MVEKYILIVCALVSVYFFSNFASAKSAYTSTYQLASDSSSPGLISTDCWFTPGSDWPLVDCFRMQVPEDHSKPEGRYITFPVVIFYSETKTEKKAPLLHLGGGGPGGPMYLNSTYTVNELWRTHYRMSLEIGRDLIFIDPRGAGLSQPILSCGKFVDNERFRFEFNYSLKKEFFLVEKDYRYCIDEFLIQGIDFSHYNSFSIANDIETLRKAVGVDQWVMLGVSYGSIYAQTITERFPSTVESMVLDSATFAHIKIDHLYVERKTAPFRILFNYCDSDPDCYEADIKMEQRIWQLYDKFNKEPLALLINHPFANAVIPFQLNGSRLMEALNTGIYSTEIFKELPNIITDLESRRTERIKPYVTAHIQYLLDRSWGDLSALAHYCYEDKPFIDFELLSDLINQLPSGYIQDSTRLYEDRSRFCERMKIKASAPHLVLSKPTSVPTLFLQGEFDSITPVSDVEANLPYFINHELITFNLSHSIITATPCADHIASIFIENHKLPEGQWECD